MRNRYRPFARVVSKLRDLRQVKPEGWKQPSRRELQILALAATGLSYALIAKKLSLSPSTVKNTLYKLGGKLGSQGAANAVLVAWRRGILQVRSKAKTIRPLSRDERRVLSLIAQGFTNSRIQHELNMTRRTLLNTVESLKEKLGGAKNRTELIAIAIHFGLLEE